MNFRLTFLLGALAATLAAVWWVEERGGEASIVEPVVAARRTPAKVDAGARAGSGQVPPQPPVSVAARSVRFEALGPDLFPVQSWQPPPPPPSPPPPPPPPAAPPLPFQYLGHWQEGREEVYFLAQGEQLHTLKRGDAVGAWRLDEAAPGQLAFTYVPMNERRTLRWTP